MEAAKTRTGLRDIATRAENPASSIVVVIPLLERPTLRPCLSLFLGRRRFDCPFGLGEKGQASAKLLSSSGPLVQAPVPLLLSRVLLLNRDDSKSLGRIVRRIFSMLSVFTR